jgi:deoxyribodipyrimidine photo-lyase
MYGLRKTQDARAEADHIQERHGSRLSGLPPSGRRASAPSAPTHSLQRDLFE